MDTSSADECGILPADLHALFALRVTNVSAYACLAPTPAVVSSFGARRERGALLVALENESGHVGWGEIWCGMPAAGALHRLALLREFVAPFLAGQLVRDIPACVRTLGTRLAPVEILAGERGPVSQILAGLDSALWDLRARVAGLPLHALLGTGSPTLRCYASGIAPDASEAALDRLRSQGHRAFKFKAGFDDARTLPLLADQRRRLMPSERMMIDANCGWTPRSALAAVRELREVELEWIEEPIRPDCADDDWMRLREAAATALAGGENLFSEAEFSRASAWLGVVQPDVAKWGGVSQALRIGREVERRGGLFCPHSFGTHIAAMTSAHVLAAVGGRGYLELDVNDNPLRASTSYAGWIAQGSITLPDAPGIGVGLDVTGISTHVRDSFSIAAAGVAFT
ncbi:mandelate racemase/muconate lactonizing enzyme family protein [Pigmentiphaga sp. YJ18]|uniref:mandelate racemase/muconate lactonizing enzyme family protein n=1 Tax=Pigmentiphaga sp. YJ18 TaxID=3134907 RepID=UPI003118F282